MSLNLYIRWDIYSEYTLVHGFLRPLFVSCMERTFPQSTFPSLARRTGKVPLLINLSQKKSAKTKQNNNDKVHEDSLFVDVKVNVPY